MEKEGSHTVIVKKIIIWCEQKKKGCAI
jgi:hypothetical protein